MRQILAVTALLVLAGCSATSMSKAECRTADWAAVGYEDGVKGRASDTFGARRKSCAEHGVAANFDAYLGGHEKGLAVFCQPRNGYRLGTSGYRYSGACPGHLEQAFRTAHADGYGLHERRKARDGIARELRHSKRRAKHVEDQMFRNTARLASSATPPSRRIDLSLEIKKLAEEKAELKQRIRQLEHDHAAASDDYEAYRQNVSGRYRS